MVCVCVCCGLRGEAKLACFVFILFFCLVLRQIIVSQEAQKECATCSIGRWIRSANANSCTQTKHFQVSIHPLTPPSAPTDMPPESSVNNCPIYLFICFFLILLVDYSIDSNGIRFLQGSFGQLRTREFGKRTNGKIAISQYKIRNIRQNSIQSNTARQFGQFTKGKLIADQVLNLNCFCVGFFLIFDFSVCLCFLLDSCSS